MKNPFSKTKVFKYRYTEANESRNFENPASFPLEDILEQSTRKKCPWFSLLRPFKANVGSYWQYLRDIHTQRLLNLPASPSLELDDLSPTAKLCPGIRYQLDNTILMKAPCDMIVSYSKDAMTYKSADPIFSVGTHPDWQVEGTGPSLFKGKILLKLQIGMEISPSVPYAFLQPHYHKLWDYMVLNGVAPDRGGLNNPFVGLNLIILCDPPEGDEVKHLDIRRGDVLAYLWVEGAVSFKHAQRQPGIMYRKFVFNG